MSDNIFVMVDTLSGTVTTNVKQTEMVLGSYIFPLIQNDEGVWCIWSERFGMSPLVMTTCQPILMGQLLDVLRVNNSTPISLLSQVVNEVETHQQMRQRHFDEKQAFYNNIMSKFDKRS